MSKITEFKMFKSITVETEAGKWPKKGLELTVQMPPKHTDEEVQVALTHAEYILDTFLGISEAAKVPQFNPEDLMKHEWKSKKDPDHEGEYKKGSLAWGWDFKDKFPEEVIKALEKGPVTIDKYEFSLNDTKTLVQTKKKK